jgi:hypothetical protein
MKIKYDKKKDELFIGVSSIKGKHYQKFGYLKFWGEKNKIVAITITECSETFKMLLNFIPEWIRLLNKISEISSNIDGLNEKIQFDLRKFKVE